VFLSGRRDRYLQPKAKTNIVVDKLSKKNFYRLETTFYLKTTIQRPKAQRRGNRDDQSVEDPFASGP
jgi:hypothetical protein